MHMGRPVVATHPKFFRLVCKIFEWPWNIIALVAAAFLLSKSLSCQVKTFPVPLNAASILARCNSLHLIPQAPDNFNQRAKSDRFQPGTPSVLIRNATIWTGLDEGLDIVRGDVLMENGLIKGVGTSVQLYLENITDLVIIDVQGSWVSPGLVDLHTFITLFSTPILAGSYDGNSVHGPILPWLRAIDGLNTHDESFASSVAGGVTSGLVIPGSGSAIAGQAFSIKMRPTAQRTPTSFLIETPHGLNGSDSGTNLPLRWRHLKHTCGENAGQPYQNTRMDTVWALREAYDKASRIMKQQDEYCAKAQVGRWDGLGDFPEDLRWEALVDTLRGRVKVHTHCYEATDFDSFLRLSNEFKFEIAAFHHAAEAYLVPDVLKRAYGQPPAIGVFAAFARYKREAFRHSEFAPRILADNGIRVVLKSDHPALVSRYLLYEAQQAHYYGLPAHIALSSVITTPAEVLGLDHRIGKIEEGYDADVVVWDSHPLALGATPNQVYIDGIAQIKAPHLVQKPESLQRSPRTPNFDEEAKDTLLHDGLPHLEAAESTSDAVRFVNVANLWERQNTSGSLRQVLSPSNQSGVVIIQRGVVLCAGIDLFCSSHTLSADSRVVDLEGGSISPGLVTYGSQIGMQEITTEASTVDGAVYDPLSGEVPSVVGGQSSIIRAVDGLKYGTRDALLAYRAGVTTAVTAPASPQGLLAGLSTHFSLGARHKLDLGAVVRDVAALHVAIERGGKHSVSTQIEALRRLLLDDGEGERAEWFKKATKGIITLVVQVNSADIIASLLELKRQVEGFTGKTMKMTLAGAAEAHLLAEQIATAGVGVILAPPRAYPYDWDSRRAWPGPPLTARSTFMELVSHGVTVGIGPQGIMHESGLSAWAVKNLRFDAGWIQIESQGRLSQEDVLAMVSTTMEKLLGVYADLAGGDLVASRGGGLLSFEGKVVAVISPRRNVVDLF